MATLTRAAETVPRSTVLGSGDAMTRGEADESVLGPVDLIAHDSCNRYCFRSSCSWDFPDESGAWEKGVRPAETQGKQLIIAETASHPGCAAFGQPNDGLGGHDYFAQYGFNNL